MEGPTWNLGEEAEVWTRNGPIKVILKRLDNSQNINQDFLNQFYLKSYADVINVCKVDRLQIQLIQEICSGSRPNIVGGTPPIFTKLMLQCLDADPSNRPTASQLCEYLRNWFIAICDDPDPSELSNQFIVAEAKFANRDNLRFNIIPCHENTIYFSRTLYSIY
ncbi:kinase-like domain-containing protein [Rhizophagus irregularis DAOM 181602=DAOM 197198]|nr:kinase-like domain-containing protein [Rhizophagus irregularis DAOM 181602=DAOM 197198]